MLVYVNKEFLQKAKAQVSINDRGFRYGDGIFETVAVYSGVMYQWKLHLDRLKAG